MKRGAEGERGTLCRARRRANNGPADDDLPAIAVPDPMDPMRHPIVPGKLFLAIDHPEADLRARGADGRMDVALRLLRRSFKDASSRKFHARLAARIAYIKPRRNQPTAAAQVDR